MTSIIPQSDISDNTLKPIVYEKIPLNKTMQSTVICYTHNALINNQSKDKNKDKDNNALTFNKLKANYNANANTNDKANVDICRICYELGTKDNALVSPCECEGSMKYIHIQCLKKWIGEPKGQVNSLHCEICKKDYNLQYKDTLVFSKDKWNEYKTKTLIVIILLTLVMLIGGIFIWLCLRRIGLESKAKRDLTIITVSSMALIYFILVFSVVYSVKRKCYVIKTELVTKAKEPEVNESIRP